MPPSPPNTAVFPASVERRAVMTPVAGVNVAPFPEERHARTVAQDTAAAGTKMPPSPPNTAVFPASALILAEITPVAGTYVTPFPAERQARMVAHVVVGTKIPPSPPNTAA